MKKLIAISILLVLLSATAFAQMKVGFSSRFVADAVFFEKATGDMAETDSVKGAFDIFSSSRLIGNELKLDFKYTGDHFEAYLQVNGNGLVERGSYLFGGGSNFLDIVGSGFGDYYAKGNAWIFRGYAGNTAQRGLLDGYRFANFGDFVGGKLENYGVIKYAGPTSASSGKAFLNLVGSATDTDNLKWDTPYISLGVDLNTLYIPLRIEVGSNAVFSGWENTMGLNGSQSYVVTKDADGNIVSINGTAKSADSIAGAFRVSGGKIADFVSFDVIYRINGADPDTRLVANNGVYDPVTTDTPLGGVWNNELGAYVGLDIFSGFKIGAGYTAAFNVIEKTRVDTTNSDSAVIEYVTPVFNGISLHLNFTGVPNLAISLNNNLSFAWQRGENEVNTSTGGRLIVPMGYRIPAWHNAGTLPGLDSFAGSFAAELDPTYAGNMINTDQKDSWFALWNSLGITYTITPKASVTLAITNRLGVYDFVAKPDEYFAKWTTDNFQTGLSGNYAFSSNVSFAAGLNVSIWGTQADITLDKQITTGKIGEVRLAIPMLFKVGF